MTVNSIQFTFADLRPYETTEQDGLHWVTPEGNVISIHHYPLPPDIPYPLGQIEAIRRYYRSMISAQGALVEVEPYIISALNGLRTLFKFPMQEHGMIYVGSVTLPFADQSFVIKIQAPERGTTGVRDSIVLMKLGMGPDNMQPPAKGIRKLFSGKEAPRWFQDPYDKDFWSPVLRNLSDDREYDQSFPDHPLSQARRFLDNLESSVQLSPEIFKLKPFPN